MRISKDPEVRKQEMIDTAMKVFARKGYEAASMTDVAKEMNVVPGLCYRYFKSKEELYETAIHQYAMECSEPMVKLMEKEYDTLDDCMEVLSAQFVSTDGTEKYHEFFHGAGNERFHKQLESEMYLIIEPYACKMLERLNKREKFTVTDINAAARFLLCGQMAIINDDNYTSEQKTSLVKEYIRKILTK